MPTDEGLGTDDRDNLQDRWKPSIQLDEEQAIIVREPDPPTDLTAQHSQLPSEGCILCCKAPLRLKWRDQDVKDKIQQRDHRAPTRQRGGCAPWAFVTGPSHQAHLGRMALLNG